MLSGRKRHTRQLRQALGVGVSLCVFIFGAIIGQYAYQIRRDAGFLPMGGLDIFRPAVLFAAGRGMIFPESLDLPELDRFLSGALDRFDPEALPREIPGNHLFRSPTESFALTHWGLYYALGWCWRLFGITHDALGMLCALMAGIAALALYRIFRSAVNLLFACAGVLLTITLPAWLVVLPDIRDFGKAPLMLLFIALVLAMLRRRKWAGELFFWALLLGLFLGLGYGFRQDLLICVPVAVMLHFIAPLYEGYHTMRRVCAAALFCLVFFVCAIPVLAGMRQDSGSVSSHTLFQGLSRQAEQTMGFGDAAYDLLLTPSDTETHAVVNAHARKRGVKAPMDLYLSPAYGEAGRDLFMEWARQFPADLFHRGLASMEAVTRLASLSIDHPDFQMMARNSWLRFLKPLHIGYIRYVEDFRLAWILAAIIALALRSRKHALRVLLILAYFMAYPNLLFQLRHTFHLAFITPWAALFTVEQLARGLLALPGAWMPSVRGHMRHNAFLSWRAAYQSVGLVLALILVTSLISGLVSFAQWRSVAPLLETYQSAELTPVATTIHHEDHHVVFVPDTPLPGLEESWNLPVGDAATAYLALEFAPSKYAVPVTIAYKPNPGTDFTRTILVPPSEAITMVYAPVYELVNFMPYGFALYRYRFQYAPLLNFLFHRQGITLFHGIRISKGDAKYLRQLYVVQNPDALPWLLYLRLPEKTPSRAHWRKHTLLEKEAASWPVEIRKRLDGDAKRAVEAYFSLSARFPEHRPYKRRLRRLADALPEDAYRVEVLYRLARAAPEQAGLIALELARLGASFMDKGLFEDAATAYFRAMELAPEDRWHHVGHADALLAQDKVEAAFAAYAAVLRDAPESAYTALRLDEACERMNTPAPCEAFWRQIHEDQPDLAVPALHWGKALENKGLLSEALDIYTRAVALHPDNAALLLRQGILLAITEGYAKGRALMDKALEMDEALQPRLTEGLVRIAEHYIEIEAYAFAEAIYREIIAQAPDDMWYKIKYGEILRAQGSHDAAVKLFMEILEAAPESPYSAQKLDELFEKVNHPEQRIEFWRALSESNREAAVPQYHLGLALKAAGQVEEAADGRD